MKKLIWRIDALLLNAAALIVFVSTAVLLTAPPDTPIYWPISWTVVFIVVGVPAFIGGIGYMSGRFSDDVISRLDTPTRRTIAVKYAIGLLLFVSSTPLVWLPAKILGVHDFSPMGYITSPNEMLARVLTGLLMGLGTYFILIASLQLNIAHGVARINAYSEALSREKAQHQTC